MYDTFAAALGICHKETLIAVRWARWLRRLGGLRETPLHLTFTDRAWSNENPACKRLLDELRSTFGRVDHDTIDDHGLGHPGGANQLFLHAMRKARQHGRPIIWLETDLVPLERDWLIKVARDYHDGGKPFCGPLCGQRTRRHKVYTEYMNGTGIYPPDWEERTDLAKVPDNDAFDTWAADTIRPNMHESDIWQHRSYVGQAGYEGPRLEDVRPGIIMFHQDKFLNLTR